MKLLRFPLLIASGWLVSTAPAALVNRWTFSGPAGPAPAGTIYVDEIGSLPLTVRGLGATVDGSRIVLPGTTTSANPESSISAYLDLPNGIVSAKSSITVEMWAAPLGSRNWQPLFEFGRMNIAGDGLGAPGEWTGLAAPGGPGTTEGSDLLGCSFQQGNNLNSQYQVVMTNGGFQSAISSALPTTPGTTYHYVIAVQGNGATCSTAWYRNGSLVGTGSTPFALSAIEDVNNWIGRSMWSGNSTSYAAWDEIRIYNHALTPAEAAANFAAGPTLPPPVAQSDAATLHHQQKVRIAVLANDAGNPNPATVEVVTPPAGGSAVVDSAGRILYTHSTGTPATDSFTYRVSNGGGPSAPAAVNLTFATGLRIPNAAIDVPAAPPATTITVANAFGALTFNQPINLATAPGDAQRLFVVERQGLVRLVADVTAASPAAATFLNLNSVLTGRGESLASDVDRGLMSMACHPDYAANGHFFLWYCVRSAGVNYWRVSRFTRAAGNPNTANAASEVILIQQADPNGYHLGTDMHFGPDGYLYFTMGDGGGQNDSRQVSQRINQDFWSAIARIDVDKRPENPEPNVHASVPRDGAVARYSVPAGNPWVTANPTVSFNGANLPATSVRTEFFAVGLRNPWRFSFDGPDLWLGDVGQITYEEINLVTGGGNYGWSFREGTGDGPQMWRAPVGFTGDPPLYQYGNSVPGAYNRSITGGFVYRGTRIPALTGAYIFADYMTGDISSLRRLAGGGSEVQRIAGEAGIVAFAADPSNGDVLLVDIADGRIRRLTTGGDDAGFPATLSATGLFADVSTLSPAPGLLPYTPNLSFWSDHAIKRRWFIVPDAVSTLTWQREGAWTWPDGMIWVKHFDLELTRGNPATAQRIETRLLVKNAGGAYGVSYRWNAAQTEATLVPDAGEDIAINIVENGNPRVQNYRIPGRAQCLSCHTPGAGHALSFNTRQLNLTAAIHGFTGNQIDLLHHAGYFSNTPDSPNLLPRHLRPDETQFPIEARVRSYLDVNCANCHTPAVATAPPSWDARAPLSLFETGLINGAAVGNNGNPLNRLIVPGDLTHSIVLNRVASANGFTRMPPLGSSEPDTGAIALLTEWINALPNRQDYPAWRLAQFSSANSAEGAPDFDADGDGRDNHHEFLAGTNPRDAGGFLTPRFDGAGLSFSLPANRSWQVESSHDFSAWSLWDVPGNAGLPHPGGPAALTGPFNADRQFFRVRLREN